MSKAKWGGIIVVAVVVAIIVLLSLKPSGQESQPTGQAGSGSSVQPGGDDTQNNTAESGSAATESGSVATESGGESTESGGESTESGGESTESRSESTESRSESTGNGAASGTGRGRNDTELEKEAESYVKKLTEPSDLPLEVHNAEGFVKPEQTLASSMPDAGQTQAAAPVETPEVAAEEGSAQQQAAETAPVESSAPADGSQEGASGTRQATARLPLSEESPVTIADIVGSGEDVPPDAVYYVHTVRDSDVQGIWGIVQQGVVENFAQGVVVRHGGSLDTYRVKIPRNADERRSDNSSSFLGRLIYEKSHESYVYNYETGRVGKNPDFITPGQEIVIVSFTPEELIEIYKHFARKVDG